MFKLFGFDTLDAFMVSAFRPDMIAKAPLLFISFSATVAAFVEFTLQSSGMPAGVFTAFMAMNLIEIVTGVWASMHEGRSFSSAKFGRAILKWLVYVGIIMVVNQFRKWEDEIGNPFAEPISWTYYFVTFGITIILIRSVFENLHRLGVKEAQTVNSVLGSKWLKWTGLAILSSPPPEEKSERQ